SRWKSSSEINGLKSVCARPRYRSRYTVSMLPASINVETSAIGSVSIFPSRAVQHALRVSRDHDFLVGRDRPRTTPAAGRADDGASRRIRLSGELDSQPGGVLTHPLANRRGMFADPTREDDRRAAAGR